MFKRKSLYALLCFVLLLAGLFPLHSATAIAVELNANMNKNLAAPSSNGMKRWGFTTWGQIFSSPAIGTDGTVYVGSNDGKLYAVNKNGTKKWEFVTGDQVTSSPAIGADGTIYVGSDDKKLYAIKLDGAKKWEFVTEGRIFSTPAIGSDGTVYVGSYDKKLYAIKPDGTKKWEFVAGDVVSSSPTIGADGTIYVGSRDKKLYAIKPDGTKKWEFVAGQSVESSPAIISDGTIYVGSEDKKLYAIKPDGTKKWEFVMGGAVYSSPVIGVDGTVYVGSYDKKLYAIKPDGTKKWEFVSGDVIFSSPAIGADGTIFVGSGDKKLYAINPNGTKKWEFATEKELGSSPAIGPDGAVYIGSSDTILYAVGMVYVSGVSINKTELALKVGQSETLQAAVTPDDATFKDIAWSSNDARIATVDNTGKVTGIAPGKTTITATAENGGYFKQCEVTVTKANDTPSPGNTPAPDISLSDINGHWAKNNVIQAVNKGIVSGYPDGTFKPDRSVSRAEFAVLLMNALKPPGKGAALTFEDKDTIGSWAVKEIAQCVELGIINGYPDGTFGPNKTINHAEMITMVVRAGNLPTIDNAATQYLDNAAIPDYARSKAAAAELYGIASYITDNKFKSEEPSTRAESVTAIMNMLKVKK
ncbi:MULTISPECIES: beta-alanine-activating enzyme beta-propeller domain-containing protein [unclassified Paenibacillus]|uniref:beta-alanine-activating enzyme beta-propeller domain-containing protein n=1 Tax=unclassified Paenibacillus TaxID=185978 RepID=UPI00362978E3